MEDCYLDIWTDRLTGEWMRWQNNINQLLHTHTHTRYERETRKIHFLPETQSKLVYNHFSWWVLRSALFKYWLLWEGSLNTLTEDSWKITIRLLWNFPKTRTLRTAHNPQDLTPSAKHFSQITEKKTNMGQWEGGISSLCVSECVLHDSH